ncbi:Panton-Valentine leukocidin LukF-PV chain precursor [Staphylococcus aureus]|nr:Panton-Valentine leukocidin LukF-PV chain precursor [Staphylococcus aureus]
MKFKNIVKSSVATSITLIMLSNTVDAAQHITPVSEKKVDDKSLCTKRLLHQILTN